MNGTQMQLEDWLDDLCVRFIINLPEEDLSSVARICFQVEEAQWFYEDFIRPLDPSLPSMSLRTFCLRIFQHCPLLSHFSAENHTLAFEQFLQYKTRVPVRGAILLNHAMDSCVLVKGWKKGANWSFPRGKINKDEDHLDCAIREVWEETGLDLKVAGLVPEGKIKPIDVTIREQQIRLYPFRDIPMDTKFEPQTRKEISKIEWYKLSDLPAYRRKNGKNEGEDVTSSNTHKFYMVAPFLQPLKKWIAMQRKLDMKKSGVPSHHNPYPSYPIDEAPAEDDSWQNHNEGRTPAINTLEGATHELQRLLKVQPPTQGIQPPQPSLDDKASALLSMLQVGHRPAQHNQTNSHMAQTPLDLTGNIHQPSNPHHQSNQHTAAINTNQPPPHFSLYSGQNQQGYTWNATQSGQYQPQQLGAQQATLVHPQPLPPQVQLQRAVFNRSTFQDPQSVAQNMRPQQQQQQHQKGPSHLGQMTQHSNISKAQHQLQQQTGPLDGKSRALLDAFKRDAGKSPSAQSAVLGERGSEHSSPKPWASYGHQSGGQQSRQAAGSPRSLATNTARTDPLSNNHRSALLGMFKSGSSPEVAKSLLSKAVRDSTPPQPQAQVQTQKLPILDGQQKSLLSALRGAYTEANAQLDPDAQATYNAQNTGAALSNFLALKGQPEQPPVPKVRPTQASNASAKRTSGSSKHMSEPAQPIRILQRGQAPETNFGASPSEQPQNSLPQNSLRGKSPYSEYQSQSQSQFQPGSLDVASIPSPSTSFQRPDQKRQLLSLFGSQPKQSVLSGGLQTSDHGPSSDGGPRTSPRGGNQTPISPAQRTFLLDYLQSVTHNASSR